MKAQKSKKVRRVWLRIRFEPPLGPRSVGIAAWQVVGSVEYEDSWGVRWGVVLLDMGEGKTWWEVHLN